MSVDLYIFYLNSKEQCSIRMFNHYSKNSYSDLKIRIRLTLEHTIENGDKPAIHVLKGY